MTDEKLGSKEVIKTRPCKLCGIEVTGSQVHLSLMHCTKDMAARIAFLRGVTLGQAKELDWERTAIQATHRMAYILLTQLVETGRLTLPRAAFEKIHPGAGVTLSELENGDFEVVAVLPDESKKNKTEEKPS